MVCGSCGKVPNPTILCKDYGVFDLSKKVSMVGGVFSERTFLFELTQGRFQKLESLLKSVEEEKKSFQGVLNVLFGTL